MGNNPVSCCWNSRDEELDKTAVSKKAPSLRKDAKRKKNKNKISDSEDDDENEVLPQKGAVQESENNENKDYMNTNISNINPNVDDTKNEMPSDVDISVSQEEDDDLKFSNQKEISAPKLHNNTGLGNSINSIGKAPNKQKTYINITLKSLEVKCDNLSDYGVIIKPFIEMFIDFNAVRQIRLSDEQYNEGNSISVNESLNTTNLSRNNSMLKSALMDRRKDGEIKDFKEKVFNFTFSETFEFSNSHSFGVIFISLKNENGNFTSDVTPNITIGTCLIPVRSLINKYFNSEFKGAVEILCREIQLVGILNLEIKVSEKPIEAIISNNNNLFSNSMMNSNIFNEDNYLNNDEDFIERIYRENDYIHYEHLDENTIDKYFVSNYTFKESHVKEVKSFNFEFFLPEKLNEKSSFNPSKIKQDDLLQMLGKAHSNKNFFLLHLVLITLNKLIIENESETTFEIIERNLFSKLKREVEEKDNIDFFVYNIPKFCSYNTYIIKNYFKFLYYYLKYYRNHKNIKKREECFFDESVLITKVAETIKTLNDKIKKEQSKEGYKLEIISTIISGFNVLTELCTIPREAVIGGREEIQKRSLEDYSFVYKNCIEILQKRYSFLRPIEVFPHNSQILSFITRIFRKVLQMIFSPTREIKKLEIIAKKLEVHPKDLINTIRVSFNFLYFLNLLIIRK